MIFDCARRLVLAQGYEIMYQVRESTGLSVVGVDTDVYSEDLGPTVRGHLEDLIQI